MIKRMTSLGRTVARAAFVVLAVTACTRVARDQTAFQQATRAGTALAYEQFAQTHRGSPLADEARKRDAQVREEEAVGQFKRIEGTKKISVLERFLAEYPGYPHLVLLAKLRIAELDYASLESQNPFRTWRPSNASWSRFANFYAFTDYIPVPEDSQERDLYYKRLHPLIVRALTEMRSFDSWMDYLRVYVDSPLFDQATLKAEAYITARPDKWQDYEMLRTYLTICDQEIKRPCARRDALIARFGTGLAGVVEEQNRRDQYQRYLRSFPNAPERKKTIRLMEHLELQEARERNDRARLMGVVQRSQGDDDPMAQGDVREATRCLERLDYNDAMTAGTPQALRDFKAQYKDRDYARLIPDADARLQAMHDQMLTRAKASGSAVLYRRFLEMFPDSPERGKVETLRSDAEFRRAIASNDREGLMTLLSRYPTSTLRAAALNRLDDMDFDDERTKAVSEPSTAPLKRYLDRRPPGLHVREAEQWISRINQYHADYVTQLQRARESRNVQALESWVAESRTNPYVAQAGGKEVRRLMAQLVVGDLTTTATPPGPGILPGALTRALTECGQAVGLVKSSKGKGTGFVFTRGGLVLADASLVRDADPKTLAVRIGGFDHDCEVVYLPKENAPDLAVLRIEGTLPVMPLGNPSVLEEGDKVSCLTATGEEVATVEGIFQGFRRAGGTEWLVIESGAIRAESGGVVVNRKARAVGLLVSPALVDARIKEKAPERVHALSLRSAISAIETAIRGE